MIPFKMMSSVVLLSLLLHTANSQLTRDILSTHTASVGGTFTMTCAVDRVINKIPQKDSTFTRVSYLQLKYKSGSAQDFTIVAQYSSYGAPEDLEVPPKLEGRDWTARFNGSNGGQSNRDSMRVEVLVPNVQCEDQGQYQCIVYYIPREGGTERQDNTQNLTVEAAIGEPVLTLEPLFNAPAGFTNFSYYDIGFNVTMKCRVEGPPGLEIKWRREQRVAVDIKPPRVEDIKYEDYPFINDTTVTDPTELLPSSPCPRMQYISVLKFPVSEFDTDRRYQCVIRGKELDVATAVAIIDLEKDRPPTTAAPVPGQQAAEPNKGDIGIIVGPVIGGVVLIIIVAVIIAVVCHKRKSKNKNKDDTDKPETNGTPYTPQPVAPPLRPSLTAANTSYNTAPEGHARDASSSHTHSKRNPQPMSVHSYDNLAATDDLHYASMDVSGSETGSVNQPVVSAGKNRPKSNRFQPVPIYNGSQGGELNYAVLDLAPSRSGTFPVQKSVEYAEISV